MPLLDELALRIARAAAENAKEPDPVDVEMAKQRQRQRKTKKPKLVAGFEEVESYGGA